MTSHQALKDFQKIPVVGKSIAQDYWDLGFRSLDEIKNVDPGLLFDRLCALRGCRVDRCMLYVFRCAHYFVNEKNPDPEKLKWWNWKEKSDQLEESGS